MVKGSLKKLVVEAARTRDARVRDQVARAMKRQGLKKLRVGDVEARLVHTGPAPLPGRLRFVEVESYDEAVALIAGSCKVEGCGDPVLAKGMCQKHYGRARRGQPLDVEPRRGLVQLVIHVEPALKRWLRKTAKRDKVSVSQRASMLLQSEKDSLEGKSPF